MVTHTHLHTHINHENDFFQVIPILLRSYVQLFSILTRLKIEITDEDQLTTIDAKCRFSNCLMMPYEISFILLSSKKEIINFLSFVCLTVPDKQICFYYILTFHFLSQLCYEITQIRNSKKQHLDKLLPTINSIQSHLLNLTSYLLIVTQYLFIKLLTQPKLGQLGLVAQLSV